MTTVEKLKKLQELANAVKDKKSATGLALARLLKTIIDLRKELGFIAKKTIDENGANIPNELYQNIIDGKTKLSLEVLEQVITEAQKDVDHYQLFDAIKKLWAEFEQLEDNEPE